MAGTDWRKALGGSVWRLMTLNLAVFIGAHAAVLLGASEGSVTSLLCLPARGGEFARHAWTAVTYMFTQTDVMHFIFNMLWLWCFGALLERIGTAPRRMYGYYLAGGLAGAAVFVALGAMGQSRGYLLGSSAAVLSVISAAGVVCNRLRVRMMFVGWVETRWLVLAVVGFILVANSSAQGAGVLCAHVAGACTGALWAYGSTRRSRSVKVRMPKAERYRGSYSEKRVPYRRGLDATEQAQLDELLAKVKNGGYAALSAKEKETLFSLSQRIK